MTRGPESPPIFGRTVVGVVDVFFCFMLQKNNNDDAGNFCDDGSKVLVLNRFLFYYLTCFYSRINLFFLGGKFFQTSYKQFQLLLFRLKLYLVCWPPNF